MAAVRTSSEVALNRVAIVGVLVITLIFLAPIYWIASTAFKPRNLSTTIPPTIVFTPDADRGCRGPQAWAEIDAGGRFSLTTGGKKGAVAGWHLVTIAPAARSFLPPHYRDPERSGKSMEVKSERLNQCNLHLE